DGRGGELADIARFFWLAHNLQATNPAATARATMIIQTTVAPRESLCCMDCSDPIGMSSSRSGRDVNTRSGPGLVDLPTRGSVASENGALRKPWTAAVFRGARPFPAVPAGPASFAAPETGSPAAGRGTRSESEACNPPAGESDCVLNAAAAGGTT